MSEMKRNVDALKDRTEEFSVRLKGTAKTIDACKRRIGKEGLAPR